MNRSEAKKFRLQIGVLVLVLVALTVLSADVFSAPVVGRTTSQQWLFSEWNYGPLEPNDGWVNDFGTPILLVSSNSQWRQFVDQRTGIWALVGEMDIIIPNYPESQPGSMKEMLVELTWKEAGLSFLPDRPLIGVESDYDEMAIERQETPLGDGWKSTLFRINIWPNPPSEWVVIKGDILIDEVVIDTYCIPEPGTLSLLGLAAWLGLGRRRRV